jgi:hypothetical protein
VQTVRVVDNQHTVNIIFNRAHSGLIDRSQGQDKLISYIKYGGGLVFTQAYNGDVFVLIGFPHVENNIEETEDYKLIERVSPEKITEEYIIERFNEFLDQMLKWEKAELGYGTSPIGFPIGRS